MRARLYLSEHVPGGANFGPEGREHRIGGGVAHPHQLRTSSQAGDADEGGDHRRGGDHQAGDRDRPAERV